MGEVGKDVTNLCGEMRYFLYLRICANNARFLNIHIMINEAKCRFLITWNQVQEMEFT